MSERRGPLRPDDVLFAYLEARSRAQSPRSLHPVRDEGLDFADRCARGCTGGRAVYFTPGDSDDLGGWSCSHCGRRWPVAPGVLLAGEIKVARRPGGPAHQLDRAAELGAALATLGHDRDAAARREGRPGMWEERLYLRLYLWENVGSYDRVAFEANRRWRPRQRWTSWTVRRLVARCREHLARELELGAPRV